MEMFLKSKEYLKMKTQVEKEYFKLFGKYAWFDGDKIADKTPSDMNEWFKNKKICIEWVEEQTSKKGTTISISKAIEKNFYQIWSEDENMREYKEVIFNCDVAKVKPYQFNLFTGFSHFDNTTTEEINLDLIQEHMRSLCNFSESNYNYVLDWLAQIVQQPHILPHTSLIFISEEGVGKDIFIGFINEVIGDRYSHNTEKLELVCGKFNSVLGGKLLMTLNETNPVESRERVENIKFLITAEKITIEGKHKEPIKCNNYCRFIFFSNRLFAFPLEEGSRRPVIIKSSSKYLPSSIGTEENHKFFSKVVSMYKDPKYQKAFLELLKKRDISKFNPKEFAKSELHQTLEENSISPLVGWFGELIQQTKEETIKMGTVEALVEFTQYSKENNCRYEMSQTKFNVELESKYQVEKIKTGGKMIFKFDLVKLKQLLITKYKYNFENTESIEPIEPEPNPLDHGIEPDKRDAEIKSLKEEIERLKKMLETPKIEPKPEPKPEKVKKNKSTKKTETPDKDEEPKIYESVETKDIVESIEIF